MLLEARTTARYHATNVAPITGRDVLSRSVIVSDGTTLAEPARLTKEVEQELEWKPRTQRATNSDFVSLHITRPRRGRDRLDRRSRHRLDRSRLAVRRRRLRTLQ